MGGEVYAYFIKFDGDVEASFDRLKKQEFDAGRYDPCIHLKTGKYLYEFPVFKDQAPAVGPCHSSINELWEDPELGADGTRSILDIQRIRTNPFDTVKDPYSAPDLMERLSTAAPISIDDLKALLKTAQPSKQLVLKTLFENDTLEIGPRGQLYDRFWQHIGKGQARYIIAYNGKAESDILFAGFSFD